MGILIVRIYVETVPIFALYVPDLKLETQHIVKIFVPSVPRFVRLAKWSATYMQLIIIAVKNVQRFVKIVLIFVQNLRVVWHRNYVLAK